VDTLKPAREAVDHLLLGVSDRDAGIAWLEDRIGVRAAIGGSHPGRGTRNALVSLGGRRYLEILAPDPTQTGGVERSDLKALTTPRLITWAAATNDLDEVAKGARSAGQQFEGPRDGSRATPDGRMLRWRTLNPTSQLAVDGINPIPFFIEWAADAVHPSRDSPSGCELLAFGIEHPDPEWVTATLRAFGIDAVVRLAKEPALTAKLKTPEGTLDLR
jgi:hypothetical protein